jgi:hypothetical protein
MFCVAAERSEYTANLDSEQVPAAASPSVEAPSAARDLVFEELVDSASLAESYSRSLVEAAWRGDRLTVEVHLRQLRACVLALISIFKLLDGAQETGNRA